MSHETVKDSSGRLPDEWAKPGLPGLVLVFSGFVPCLLPFSVPGGGLTVGRDTLREAAILDDRVSRKHVHVERSGATLRVSDLGSTNGVFIDGAQMPAQSTAEVKMPSVLRVGRTVFLLVPDLSLYYAVIDRSIVKDGLVVGPRLLACHHQVMALAKSGQGLFLRGESGAGKEIAARLFHQAGPRSKGPLVSVNCATIPKELAERLLFGAVRGAYSGAVADSQGYLQAAHGGTLFLDEVAELDVGVQAKLLRALETREVTPLGGTKPQSFDAGLCAATLRDLREAVARGVFREDLYYRIGRPEVLLPPLRERLEEIPFLVSQTARGAGVDVSTALVEACLLRQWPGNVRELCAEVRAAAAIARSQGATVVLPSHLAETAGQSISRPAPLGPAPEEPRPGPASVEPAVPEAVVRAVGEATNLARKTVLKLLTPEALASLAGRIHHEPPDEAERALLIKTAASALLSLLESHGFQQSSVASALGVSRTTLGKLIEDLDLPRATELDADVIARVFREVNGDVEAAARQLKVSPNALKKRMASLGGKGLRPGHCTKITGSSSASQ